MNLINVIGLGYIGLPTALMFAKSKENKVVGIDYNKAIVDSLNNDLLTFKEKGLEELFKEAKENEIIFSNIYEDAKVYVVSVPTPYIKETKRIDPKYVIEAVENILDVCSKGTIIVIESTVAPGTIDKYIRPIIQKRGLVLGEDINLAHAPERIIPGNMVYELTNNSRTIGADDRKIAEYLKNIYSTFCEGEIYLTDIKSAEMSKVVENTYRDINIAFANELAKICNENDLDVYEIIRLANKHPRVNILQPGPGVGGHCISVDPWFLVGENPDLTCLIKEARNINDSMPSYVLKKIKEIMAENNIKDSSKVGIYGITYKENVDDIRESPTLQLFEHMLQSRVLENVRVYDPFVTENLFKEQLFDFNEFINGIEMIVIMVNHDQIINNINLLKEKVVFDTKNCCTLNNVYKL